MCCVVFSLLIVPVTAQRPRVPELILVISIDGARPDAILQADTPNIRALAYRGAYDWSAQTVFPPATLPAHASLLSGLEPDRHGYDDNVVRDCADFDFPTWLSLAQENGYRTAMVVGKQGLCQFRTDDAIDFTLGAQGDRSVVDRVLELLNEGYQVLFVHFPNPDYFGHLNGWMSHSYLYEFRNTDVQVGRLVQAVDSLGLTDTTLIILTADHGGHEQVHGANIAEDMTIPLLLSGFGISPNTDLSEHHLQLIDIAPTILTALDIPIPESMTGRVIFEMFDSPES
jgi:predicted AlkP superfamily pyrophosphatase or phosphodiesterase